MTQVLRLNIFILIFITSLFSADLEDEISSLRSELISAHGKTYRKTLKKLYHAHKKRIKFDKNVNDFKMSFVEDDLKYGKGRYALHLLLSMNTNESFIKLYELNSDPLRQGKIVKMKQFTFGWFQAFLNSLFGENVYEFSAKKAKFLSKKIVIKKEKPVESQVEVQKKIEKEQVEQVEIEEKKTTEEVEEVEVDSEPEIVKEEEKVIEIVKEELPKPKKKYFWEVVKTIKEVRVQKEGRDDWRDVEPGDRLYEGDIFKTGDKSSVTLFIRGLGNKDSFTQLFENTEVKVIKLSMNDMDELDDVYLDIILGEVLVNVEDLPETSTFKVKTPTAIAGVRGTTFKVKVLSNLVSIFVLLKGRLQISSKTIAGQMEYFMKHGEELVSDYNKPDNIPDKIDEATFKEYVNKANEIADEIMQKKEMMRLEKEHEDEKDYQGPEGPDDEGPQGFDVDEKTGQIFKEDGTPVLDKDGNPVFLNQKGLIVNEFGEKVDLKLLGGSAGQPLPDEFNFIFPNYNYGGNILFDPTNPLSLNYDPTKNPANYDENGNFIPPGEDKFSPFDFIPPDFSKEDFLREYEKRFKPADGPPIPPFVDIVLHVDSNRGVNAGDGTWETPFRTLPYAMYRASLMPSEKYIVIALFSYADQVYDVPSGGLKIRPRTGVVGIDPSPDTKRARISGGGTSHVLFADSGPVFLGNLKIYNENQGIGVELYDTAALLHRVVIRDCNVGVKANGVGSETFPQGGDQAYDFEVDYDKEGDVTEEHEKGVVLHACGIIECSDYGVMMNEKPGVVDIFGSLIESCGTVLSVSANGTSLGDGPNYVWHNSEIVNNTGNSPIFNITGDYSVLQLEGCKIYSNSTTNDDMIELNGDNCRLEISHGTDIYNNGGIEGRIIESGGNNNSVELIESSIRNNSGSDVQSIIYVDGSNSNMRIVKSTIRGNDIGSDIIYFDGDYCEFKKSKIFNNSAGATNNILNTTCSSPLQMINCLVVNNSVNSGRSIWMHDDSDVNMIHNTIHNFTDIAMIVISGTLGTQNLTCYNNVFSGFGNGEYAIEANDVDAASTATFHGNAFQQEGGAGINDPSVSLYFSVGPTTYQADNLPGGGANNESSATTAYVNQTLGNYKPEPSGLLHDQGVSGSGVPDDIRGVSRDANPDRGAIERTGSDPLLTGRIYDSLTGMDVDDCLIGIYVAGSSEATNIVEGSTYSFDVFPGRYMFVVSKEGLYFPSQRKSQVVPGDHGDPFTVIDGVDMTIDIPVDSVGLLSLEKTANKKSVTNGEILTYGLEVKNSYWFSEVNDIYIHDERKSGFKFVPGSVRLDGVKVDDPQITDTNYIFNLGTVKPNSIMELSYQVVASTGIMTGTYKTEAICRNSQTQTLSNESYCVVSITPDPLFTNGTLIGRVFMDHNNNGKYDTGETGVKDAIVATEYGVMMYTDEFGLFHLKNIFPGRHTLQVDHNSLPKGYVSRDCHGIGFEIFEGSITKANIPIVGATDDNPRKKFLFVSLGEITVRSNDISDNIEMVKKNKEFDEDVKVDGRGAFFLRGKILGKFLITASYDSKRLSRDQKYLRRSRILTNLDPTRYYPVYGDGSKVDYSATETKDALYVLIEWQDILGKWKAKWGSLEVDWPLYRRVMHGAQIILESTDKTRFDDDKRSADLFYAVSDHQSVYEEFIGTGTSVYHLENTPVIEGSEKVKIEFRDRFSSLPIEERILVEEVDYTIQYTEGRVILKRPLTSTILNYNQTIISNDLLAGAQAILIVEYEFKNYDIFERESFGGRVQNYFGDHISLELGFAEEERNKNPYKLLTSTAVLKFNETSSILASYNQSEESFAGGGISYDGGLNFSSQRANFKKNQEGASWSFLGNTLLFEKLQLSGTYSESEPGFTAKGTFSSSDAKSYSGSLGYLVNDWLTFGVDFRRNETESSDPTAQALAIVDHLEKTNMFIDLNREKWDARLEYTVQDFGNIYTGVRYLGSLPPRGKQLLAMRVGWKRMIKKGEKKSEKWRRKFLGAIFGGNKRRKKRMEELYKEEMREMLEGVYDPDEIHSTAA
ncbi:hypothetical protein BVX93_02380 [bacterium B13(2017)]|nr:hypothetical protein BVX93_02380 [bacterium B13(2017)]